MRSSGEMPTVTPVRALRMMLVVALVGLLFGLIGVGEVVEDLLRTDRNLSTPKEASGKVVLVSVDDASQQKLGPWPWPRRTQARIIDRLHQAGADVVMLDLSYDFPTNPVDDGAFEQALENGRTILPSFLGNAGDGLEVIKRPLPRFARHTTPSTVAVQTNWQMAVWTVPFAYQVGKERLPFSSSLLAGREGKPGSQFRIDYSYRLESFPRISAYDALAGKLPDLHGKRAILGLVSATTGDQIIVPGRGRMGAVNAHVYAAETLLASKQYDFGFLPALLLALGAVWAALKPPRGAVRAAILVTTGVVVMLLPYPLEARGVFVDIVPALSALATAAIRLGWKRYRERGLINAVTGMPNFIALRHRGSTADQALIVARVVNYPQLSAALDDAGERALVEQIAGRLGIGSQGAAVYQGDEGLFAWLVDPGTAIGHHVEALHALFRSPARIGTVNYDLTISFGVDLGSSRSLSARLSSALVAADEAVTEGLKWKYHDPERMKDSNWRLSLLAQLDEAIDKGEVWVAFQPQLDLASGRIRSAEALARWTHPVKGPISPHEFISAAESHGRIDRLTFFVLEKAIEAAARVNKSGTPFDIAVNLSARTLARRTLCQDVRAILQQHGLPVHCLTLELTETSALAGDGSDLQPLLALRDLGVRISIDDYGTGMSTLSYLKQVPASELKIDQGFVRNMRENRSDMLMVRSTINLAHSLQRTVVAEGVEDEKTLDLLTQMGCDRIQGYVVGRPMSFDSLARRLTSYRKGRAA